MASKSLHYQGNYTFSKTEKGYIVYPKSLNIVWGNDKSYWKLPNYEKDDAELMQVNWLEVTGCIDNINIAKKTSYEIGFTMSLMTDAFGWSGSPLYLMAKWGDNTQWRKVNLTTEINGKKIISKAITITKGKGNNSDKIYFGLYEVWNKKWKGGLKIHSVNLTET
ncbi:protein PHLOEM PROTEIN 2-LIKE A9-like [Solanum tuberosum]|uniref:protein PHLOEM PROTEIN 2-LIKE A9-like n=1 Tax=Solanum tuberosum TaxID=4113 RepID=UPI00073A3B5D|nr:PREDICTED: protein PHLOEM PROTEIN 2-LIKE A9-like [Solanum tuberosum]